MLITGIDIETGATFETPKEDTFITELGAVLYDTELESPVQMMNVLVNQDREVSPEATVYTGITTEMCRKYGVSITEALMTLLPLYNRADYIVGHNGLAFDKPIIGAQIKKTFTTSPFQKKPWIDTIIDIKFPSNCMNTSLTYLQGFHGFCYPGHRAIFDVMAMLKILAMYDIHAIAALANSPIVTVQAIVNGWQDKATQTKVKKAGFRWNPDNKTWTKDMRECSVESANFDFNYIIC